MSAEEQGAVLNNLPGIRDAQELREREDEEFAKAVVAYPHTAIEDMLSLEWIKGFHARIFSSLYAHAGAWRNEPIRVAWHLPPAHTSSEIQAEMEGYIADCRKRLAVLRARPESLASFLGFAFWKFTYIAPFFDGNGRCANGMSYLFQSALGLAPKALYNKYAESEYSRFVNALRAYDAGHASAFFEYLHEKLGLA